MNLLDYHRLRSKEQAAWDLPAIEKTVIVQDAASAERVLVLLQSAENRFSDNLSPRPFSENLAALSRVYLNS